VQGNRPLVFTEVIPYVRCQYFSAEFYVSITMIRPSRSHVAATCTLCYSRACKTEGFFFSSSLPFLIPSFFISLILKTSPHFVPFHVPFSIILSLPGLRHSGREVDHSPPSSVKVKNVWSYTSTIYAFMAWTATILFYI
jgi:hypothetical protein